MPFKSTLPPVPVATVPFDEVSADDAWPALKYRDVWIRAASVTAFLHSRGFGKGDVACIVLSNTWHYPVFAIGAAAAGGATSGASALFTDYELERQFLDSQASVVLTDLEHLSKVLAAATNCPRISTIIAARGPDDDDDQPLPKGVTSWDQVIMNTPPDFTVSKTLKRDLKNDLLFLPYSSGTTGAPKGVMLTHFNFGTMCNIFMAHQDRELRGKLDAHWNWNKEASLLFLPFYHIYGTGLLFSSLLNGSTGVIFSKFDPFAFLEAIQHYKIRMLCVVPPLIVFLTKYDIVDNYDLTSLQILVSGAAPAGKELCEEFLAKHKNVKFLLQGYGMTECGMASHMPVFETRPRYGSVGLLLPSFEQKIVDPVTGEELGIGKPGEILLRGPTIMHRYLNRPDATAESIDPDGWLHTGDIGYIDKDGYFFIVDRLKELIKVKGLQVPPAELEDLLLKHPRIQDAAVIGIPDKGQGELPRAYIVAADSDLTADEVKEFVATKVSAYKRLTGGVEFISEIPKSPTGKILRRFLRDKAAKESNAVEAAKL